MTGGRAWARGHAVEEIARWASPVIHFRRTVTAPTELAGDPLPEGDKLVMFSVTNGVERLRIAW